MWITSLLKCRICGTTHVAVYPSDIDDEDNQECPECGNMGCEPVDDNEDTCNL
jgi:hypothetical protein